MDTETIQLVRTRAAFRCEYCHLPERVSELRHVIDHITARQHGGSDLASNLALCCVRCSQYKGPNIAGIDPSDGSVVRLFDPRTDEWTAHFAYEGPVLIGKTPRGRATVTVLNVNHPLRLTARKFLLTEGVALD